MIGYTSYRRQSLSLDRKLNQAWSERLDDLDRLRVQNSVRTAGFSPVFDRSARQLGCCGYYNSLRASSSPALLTTVLIYAQTMRPTRSAATREPCYPAAKASSSVSKMIFSIDALLPPSPSYLFTSSTSSPLSSAPTMSTGALPLTHEMKHKV